jgi:hypothetical protein
VTKPRRHIGVLPGLPWAARKWLLGARPELTEDGGVTNSGIVRLRYLVVRGYTDDVWAKYLTDLQREWGPAVREKRRVWRERRAAARSRTSGRRRVSAKAPVG